MSDTPQVYEAIRQVMQAVGRIEKTGENPHFGYEFVEENMLAEKVRNAMVEAGLVMIPAQTEERIVDARETSRGDPVYLTSIFHTFEFACVEDGSSVTVTVWGDGLDQQDKGSYKAFTGAEKYALMKLFLIPTGDDPEHDRGHPGGSTRRRGGGDGNGKLKGDASQKQVGFIKGLLKDREVPDEWQDRIEGRIEAWKKDPSEWSKQDASDTIEKLQGLPPADDENGDESGVETAELPIENGKATASFDCPDCGAKINPGMKACDECGWLLGGPPDANEKGEN